MKSACAYFKSLLGAVFFVCLTQIASAGFFSGISTLIKEQKDLRTHSVNVGNGLKELYRERKNISEFTRSSAQLIQAYKQIRDKGANIPLIVNIAKSIDSVIRGYQAIAPKGEAVYNRIAPDLEYFSKFTDGSDSETMRFGKSEFKLDSFSESRISKLAGGAGWARVFDSVKDNPMNIFRWGKLKDEYSYGKAEGQYALKGIQIAFEARSYYVAAKSSLNQLLDIRKQMDGIVSGDWTAILGLPDTINNIQSAAGGVEDFGGLLNSAASRFSNRFGELQVFQDEYLKAHQNFAQKYQGGQAVSSNANGNTSKRIVRSSPSAKPVTGTISLQSAMEAYQNAYKRYTAMAQNSGASEAERNKAIQELNIARQRYESVKAAAAR